jgi:hypothetical protein
MSRKRHVMLISAENRISAAAQRVQFVLAIGLLLGYPGDGSVARARCEGLLAVEIPRNLHSIHQPKLP